MIHLLRPFMKDVRIRLDRIRGDLMESKGAYFDLFEWGLRNEAYPLMCAMGQEIVFYNLQEAGQKVIPFITDSIDESPFSHCSVILSSHRTGGKFLIDPTFTQFALPKELYHQFGISPILARHSPHEKLCRTETGSALWNQLKEDGFVLITPHIAKMYLDSLFPRREFDEADAYRRLSTPTYHALNLKHGIGRVWEKGGLGISFLEYGV